MRGPRAWPAAVAGVLLVLSLTAGCASSDSPAAKKPTQAFPTPTFKPPSAYGETPVPPRVSVPLSSRFMSGPKVVGYTSLGPPAIDGPLAAVAATASSGDGANWDQVVTLDAETGRSRVVAHTAYPRGLVSFVAVTGRWVLWVDQSREQSDAAPNVWWKIHALDLDTGRRRTLGSNGARPNAFVPRIYASDGYAFWATPETDRTPRQWVWRAGARHPVTLLRHAQLDPDLETVNGGRLYYLGPSRHLSTPRLRSHANDCWSLPLSGGTPTRLTHARLVMNCQAAHGWLVYELHADPNNPPRGDIGDDPFEVWALKIGSHTPVLLHRGYVSGRWPAVGDGFVLWPGGDVPMVYAPLGGDGPTVALTHTSTIDSWAISGDRVAYTTYSSRGNVFTTTFGILVHKSDGGTQPSAPHSTTRVTPTDPTTKLPGTCAPQDRTEDGACAPGSP